MFLYLKFAIPIHVLYIPQHLKFNVSRLTKMKKLEGPNVYEPQALMSPGH